jgi:hypothetical protein
LFGATFQNWMLVVAIVLVGVLIAWRRQHEAAN